MNKGKHSVIISLIFLMVIVIISTLIWHAYRIEDQMRRIETIKDIPSEELKEKGVSPVLTPSRPEDYGMTVTSEFDKPRTQAEWDEYLHAKLSELKAKTPAQTLAKIRDRVKEDPEKTREKIQKINKGIEKCREILKKEPDNKDIQAKLERLMILKGLSEGFKDF